MVVAAVFRRNTVNICMFKATIENWIVQVKGKDPQVFVYKNKVQKKIIPIDKFEQCGMILFPKELHRLITGSVRHSNTYDRLIDKLYGFLDNLEEDDT